MRGIPQPPVFILIGKYDTHKAAPVAFLHLSKSMICIKATPIAFLGFHSLIPLIFGFTQEGLRCSKKAIAPSL